MRTMQCVDHILKSRNKEDCTGQKDTVIKIKALDGRFEREKGRKKESKIR